MDECEFLVLYPERVKCESKISEANSPGWSEAEPGVRKCKEPTVRVQISIKNDIPGSDGKRNR